MTANRVDRSGPELDALFIRYQHTGDVTIRNELIVRHQWLAERCARRFQQRGEQQADLIQVAQIGLIKAVERFDPDRGIAFTSFATPTMTGEIKRHFRDATWAVSVPRRSKELRSQVQRASEQLGHRLGRSPTVEEIGEQVGVDPAAVAETLEANRMFRPASLEGAREASGDLMELQVSASGTSPEAAPGDDGLTDDRIEAVGAIRSLGERDREIVLWRFYGGCTQREIGERLGIGQVQVSRLLRSALGRLRYALDGSAGETARREPAPSR